MRKRCKEIKNKRTLKKGGTRKLKRAEAKKIEKSVFKNKSHHQFELYIRTLQVVGTKEKQVNLITL
jgi:hypothetical protein